MPEKKDSKARRSGKKLIRLWYIWLSLAIIIVFELLSTHNYQFNIPTFAIRHGLLLVFFAFFFLVTILPNWILPRILEKPTSTLFKLAKPAKYPQKYFDAMQTANNAILVIVGLVFGLFQFSGHITGYHQTRMFELFFISIFSGLIAIISQITPQIKPSRSAGNVEALPITVRIMFGSTYVQIVFAVLGFYEAYLSLL